jgi:hypothetical protein
MWTPPSADCSGSSDKSGHLTITAAPQGARARCTPVARACYTRPLSTLERVECSPRAACAKIPLCSGRRPPSPLCPHFQDDRIMLYQSDITQFINQLKQQKPTLEDEQRRGRALLWDKQPIDLEQRSTEQQARVNQTSYVYYQNF